MTEYVTPKGVKLLPEDVVAEDISIAHRDPARPINRPIYDGTNGGEKILLHDDSTIENRNRWMKLSGKLTDEGDVAVDIAGTV